MRSLKRWTTPENFISSTGNLFLSTNKPNVYNQGNIIRGAIGSHVQFVNWRRYVHLLCKQTIFLFQEKLQKRYLKLYLMLMTSSVHVPYICYIERRQDMLRWLRFVFVSSILKPYTRTREFSEKAWKIISIYYILLYNVCISTRFITFYFERSPCFGDNNRKSNWNRWYKPSSPKFPAKKLITFNKQISEIVKINRQ